MTVNVTLAVPQVISPPCAVNTGRAVSSTTIAEAVASQPLVPTTVTVYVPGTSTIGLACVDVNPLGPVH